MKLLYEGKAKKVYDKNNNEVIIFFKDDATAFNGVKKDIFFGKGKLNLYINDYIFKYLIKNKIKTHYINKLSDNEILCKKVNIIPLEVIVRNYASGSLSKRLGIKDKEKFNETVVEICYKNDSLNDPLINDYHAYMLGIVSKKELQKIYKEALKINLYLSKLFIKCNLILADFKIEFGKDNKNKIVLADEISPDCMRLWDKDTLESFDKDVYRKNTGNLIDRYTLLKERLNSINE